MKIGYPEIGICGLSCRLCPYYNTNASVFPWLYLIFFGLYYVVF